MVSANRILPGHRVPELQLGSNGARDFNLRHTLKSIENFLILVFYRGHHSDLCKRHLRKLDKLHHKFEKAGMKVVAISMDSKEEAYQSIDDWELENIEVAYGLSFEIAKIWGLFLSSNKENNGPERYNEPAVFVVQSDGLLYSAHIQSMPFGRPNPKKLLKRLKWCLKKNYPVRGGLD